MSITDNYQISFNGQVYDLTQLIQKNIHLDTSRPLINHKYTLFLHSNAAGTDISHWLDYDTQEPKMAVDPQTNMKWYYCPTGRYLHIPPLMPDSDWDPSSFSIPWWKDQSLCIGDLSDKTRKIRVINQLTKADDIIEVCSEETMNEIISTFSFIHLFYQILSIISIQDR